MMQEGDDKGRGTAALPGSMVRAKTQKKTESIARLRFSAFWLPFGGSAYAGAVMRQNKEGAF